MHTTYFVPKNSIVRQIWGKSDTVLFIFAGAAAEFALNKAVDWLYFTGRLPKDPLGRLFSTVAYARTIVFSDERAAFSAIDKITSIHKGVETKRGAKIPDWAYRDVLFLLIDYSIRAYELLERKLTFSEKQEVFQVFCRVGNRMRLAGLPPNFDEWVAMRNEHLQQDLVYSPYTSDLFDQYRKHLGPMRYGLLKETQIMLAPEQVRKLLGSRKHLVLGPFLEFYKASRMVKMDTLLKKLLLPPKYKTEINEMDAAVV